MNISKRTIREFLVYILPLLLWMAFIFPVWNPALGSNSIYETFATVFRRLLPYASQHALDLSYIIVRKSLHYVEYGLLAFLFYRAFRDGRRPLWSGRTGLQAGAAAAAYAFVDEYLQSFVPNRFGSPFDWTVDLAGIMTALALIAWAGRRRKEPPGPGTGGRP